MLALPSLSSGISKRSPQARIKKSAPSVSASVINSKKSDSRSATVMSLTPLGTRSIVSRNPSSHLELSFSSIGVTLATKAGVVDGAIVPDAGHDILKDAPPRNVEENIIGDDGRHAARRIFPTVRRTSSPMACE